MNFLAHAYLSFKNDNLLIGNLIADMVKGKQMEQYPEGICRGIYLHRLIDSFTDSHPVTIEAKEVFRQSAGRYCGSFLDVAYDHFLALDEYSIPAGGWHKFADNCYRAIEKQGGILPAQFCSMYVYMKKEDWLSSYGHSWMIERSFDRLKRRASYLAENAPVFAAFEENYEIIKESYANFFPDLKAYAEQEIKKLLN